MSDNANHEASASEAAGQPAALKSTDTGSIAGLREAGLATTAEPPKAQNAAPQGNTDAGNGDDATTADAPPQEGEARKRDRLPRWVSERLQRERESTARQTEDRIRAEYAAREQNAPRHEQRTTQAPANVNANANGQAPTLADFNFDMDAYTAHMVERGIAARDARTREEAEQRQRLEAAETFKTRIDAFETRVGAGAWQDIVESPINTDPAFADLTGLFMGSDHDLEIALHLASDLAEARRINGLSPLMRAVEIHKLAERFAEGEAGSQQSPGVVTPSALPKPPAAPLPKKTTNAPPPPRTLSGAGKSVVDIDDPNISTADRIKAWRAQRRG